MLKTCVFVLLGLLSCIAPALIAQTIPDKPVPIALFAGAREKMYIHTDKDFYLAGEIIWFKAYCVNAISGVPSSLSKVGYVEVIDETGKPVLQAKIALQNGSGHGSFLLPGSIKSAGYTLRAYTNWMKNFSSSAFFHKGLKIVNAFKKPEWRSSDATSLVDIQFFPEGGELVDGIESRVAFRVANRQGKGVNAEGVIIDERGDTVSRFSTLHAGIGSFPFRPSSGSAYRAMIRLQGGQLLYPAFPKASSQGWVMRCTRQNEGELLITVSTNYHFPNAPVFLNIISGNDNPVIQKGVLADGKCVFLVKTSALAEGVTTFTIFNFDHQPVCERLFFKPLSVGKRLDVTLNTPDFGLRSKVEVSLSRTDTMLFSRHLDLSMAVFLLDSLQGINEDEMAVYLMLTSAVKGRVEAPEYYLHAKAGALAEETDNLMLTHGWRKITPLPDSAHRPVAYLPEYEGQLISGKLTEKASGLPAPGKLTYLSAPGERYTLSNTVSDQNGDLFFVLDNNYGSTQISVQTNSVTDSNYVVSITDPFSVGDSDLHVEPLTLPENLRDQLTAHSVSAQVQSSFEGENRLQFSYPLDVDSTAFYGIPDKKFFLDDYTRFPTMEEVFREFVADVYLKKRGEEYSLTVRDIPNSVVFKDGPLVLIDGIPVFDVNKLVALDPLKIKKIEVVNKQVFQGNMANSGIVSCTSYNGDLAGYELDRNATVLEFPGLSFRREFFSPVYDTEEKTSSPMADARSLLYWNPEIVLDKNSRKNLSFFTSDIPGKYAVFVQGIGSDGTIYQATKQFTVR